MISLKGLAKSLLAPRRLRRNATQTSGHPSAFSGYQFTEHARFRPFNIGPEEFLTFQGKPNYSELLRAVDDASFMAPFICLKATSAQRTHAFGTGLKGGDFSIYGRFDPAGLRAEVVLNIAGEEHILADKKLHSIGAFVAVTFTENTVTLWEEGESDWVPVLTHRMEATNGVDLRNPAQLQGLRSASFGPIDDLQSGYFGYIGLRDPQLVKYSDGRKYEQDNRVLMTMTCAGPGFFQAAHWGIFSVSITDPTDLKMVGNLFFQRDGMVVGDHAGQIIIDDDGSFIVAVSSWGDFSDNVHVRHARTQISILDGTHVLDSAILRLPSPHGCWDPSLLRYKDEWWISFVECIAYSPRFDFHPALARGLAYDNELTFEAAETLHHQTEGTLITMIEGVPYIFASDGDTRDYPVYDMRMNRISQLDAPYGTNIPHPLLIDTPGGPWFFTFDGEPWCDDVLGYGTHGDIIIYRS